MNRLDLNDYNLHATLMGGQSFAWNYFPKEHTYIGATQHCAIKLVCAPGSSDLFWQTYPVKGDFDFIKSYLRLDVNYPKILSSIIKDEHMRRASSAIPDLRLLNQEVDETILSFIISSNNSVKSIRTRIARVRKALGRQVDVDGHNVFLFPETSEFAAASVDNLRGLGLGYRAAYVKQTAELMTQGILFSDNYMQVRKELMQLPGVGPKVADCILVFALGYEHITPLDVWGKRVLNYYYGLDAKSSYESMQSWVIDYFNGYGAWAGQLLFEYIRARGIFVGG